MHKHDLTRYQHSHVFHLSGSAAERKTLRVVLLTVVMMVVEIVAGWLFNSMALLADGWHMSTHAAALGIAWLAFILARRHSGDRTFTFGTWKIEILGGFVSAILLGLVALAMTWVSVERLVHPAVIRFNEAILVAIVGLAVNVASIVLLTGRPHGDGHRHERESEDHIHGADPAENLNLRAAYLHVVADALTSIFAIVALLGGEYLGWCWLDPVMGLVGAVMIARWTGSLLSETGRILLDRGDHAQLEGKIRTAMEGDGDTKVVDLHLWQVGQEKYACVLSVVAARPPPLSAYKDRLQDFAELAHVTVEVNPCAECAK